jgi:hypothetical protein
LYIIAYSILLYLALKGIEYLGAKALDYVKTKGKYYHN